MASLAVQSPAIMLISYAPNFGWIVAQTLLRSEQEVNSVIQSAENAFPATAETFLR
jgi:hypothetical protein